jgi:HEAT repeats
MNGDEDKTAALIAGLSGSQKTSIRAAVDALIISAGQDSGVRRTLEQTLDNAQHRNPWAVAYVLGQLPQPSAATIRALLAALDHHEADIRWAVALLIVRLAKTENVIVDLLLELARRGSAKQKRMAVYCIRDLQLQDDASLEALLAASSDSEPAVRVAAVTSLKTRSNAGPKARKRLFDLFLTDMDVKVCNAAAITLAQLGAPSEEFVAALRVAAHSENAALKKAATAALSLLKMDGK